MTFHTIAARCNCPSDWGRDTRCPKCHQFHLRLGYCQALNPEASAAIAAGGVDTLDEARRLAALPEELTLPPPGPFSFETEEEKLRRLAHARTVLAGAEKRVGKKAKPVTTQPPEVTTPVTTVATPVTTPDPVTTPGERRARYREAHKAELAEKARIRRARERQAD